MRERGAAGLFPSDDPAAAAAELAERAETLGIDEIVVPAELTEAFAPVLQHLGG